VSEHYQERLENALKSIKVRIERANFKGFAESCLGTLILEDVAKALNSRPVPYDERETSPDEHIAHV
jgi:hypothetical protein